MLCPLSRFEQQTWYIQNQLSLLLLLLLFFVCVLVSLCCKTVKYKLGRQSYIFRVWLKDLCTQEATLSRTVHHDRLTESHVSAAPLRKPSWTTDLNSLLLRHRQNTWAYLQYIATSCLLKQLRCIKNSTSEISFHGKSHKKGEKQNKRHPPFTLQSVEVITKLKGKRQSAQYKICRACVWEWERIWSDAEREMSREAVFSGFHKQKEKLTLIEILP